ncbi:MULTISPECIES: hypothetical protein [Phaeobacter]|nr:MULTISPECIES: hypothetical protein [Phaeobacter]
MFLEDMRIKDLQPQTQTQTQTIYLRAMHDFTRFARPALGSATPQELRKVQLAMKERGVAPEPASVEGDLHCPAV